MANEDLSARLGRVEEKLARLKRLDRRYSIFGSSRHEYRLNPPVPKERIVEFEEKHGVHLPFDYRCFIRFVGDGGAGPFYGLGQLEDGVYMDMDSRRTEFQLDLSRPFPHIEAWNLEYVDDPDDETKRRAYEEEYFDRRHAPGLLRLCNFGCGVFINLVVNGPESGNMWTDDRINDNGIFPSQELGNDEKLKFIDWYELWLDQSITKAQED